MTDASTINLSLIFECFMVGNFFFYLGHDIEWYDLGHEIPVPTIAISNIFEMTKK